MARVTLGLGSNVGDRRANLQAALHALESRGIHLLRASSLYETDPTDYHDQPRFLNAVVEAETDSSPLQLLASVKEVERQVGRTPGFRYGPREIDVDILLYDDLSYDSQDLTVPHPRMANRAFVQAPLRELAGQPASPHLPGVDRVEGPEWAAHLQTHSRTSDEPK